jgi:hypothetical protein
MTYAMAYVNGIANGLLTCAHGTYRKIVAPLTLMLVLNHKMNNVPQLVAGACESMTRKPR